MVNPIVLTEKGSMTSPVTSSMTCSRGESCEVPWHRSRMLKGASPPWATGVTNSNAVNPTAADATVRLAPDPFTANDHTPFVNGDRARRRSWGGDTHPEPNVCELEATRPQTTWGLVPIGT